MSPVHRPKTQSFMDRFWWVRWMINEFSDNIVVVFMAGWVCCIGEYMSIWTNRWTCLGWVFCPRRKHPFGNQYHTIYYGLSGILFIMEMVEGNDWRKELPRDSKTKKTINLLLCLCFMVKSVGNVIILYSGFCVLESIIALKNEFLVGSWDLTLILSRLHQIS